jgi:hypothetical protein
MEFDKQTIKQDQYKSLSKPTFLPNCDIDIKLSDPILLYTNGINWKAVPLYIFNSFPIIYDEYFDENDPDQKPIPITIYHCPFTMLSVVLFGTFTISEYTYKENLLLKYKDTIYIPFKSLFIDSTTKTIMETTEQLRKKEVRLVSLHNTLTLYPDCVFFDINQVKVIYNESDKKIKKICYMIEYVSRQNKLKYTVLIPQKVSYDIVHNSFTKYFDKMKKHIKKKGSIIYPVYYESLTKFNLEPKPKTVNL